jgi:hypothetical protein
MINFAGVEFAIVSTLLGYMWFVHERQISSQHKELAARFPTLEARPLADEEFYYDFMGAIAKSKHSVAICYFAPYPPSASSADREWYYAKLEETMIKRPNIHFRRIVRATKENEKWVTDLIHKFAEYPNVNIGFLKDSETQAMPLALSVQIVDEDQLWLVALNSHEKSGEHRDLFLRSKDATKMLKVYYERLWSRAVVVMEAGRVTPPGERLIQRTLESAGE